MQTLVDHDAASVHNSLRNVQPVKVIPHDVRQTAVILPSVRDNTSGRIQNTLQLVRP